MRRRFPILLAVSLLLALALSATASAAPAATRYSATLTGAEEVPSNASPATGAATFEVSADGSAITYSVSVTNLSNLVQGHIHIGARGANGPVAAPLFAAMQPGGGVKNGQVAQGTITADKLDGPLKGQPLSALIAAMDGGTAYVNLHTNNGRDPANEGPGDLPAGEIRGQIVAAGTPGLPNTGAGGGTTNLPFGWALALAAITLGAGAALGSRRRARRPL